MKRVLLVTATTAYQADAFRHAASRVGVSLVLATDRCEHLADPWRDGAVPVRFDRVAQSADAVVDAVRATPLDGVVAIGDRPAVLAAHVAEALGLPAHPAAATEAATDKLLARGRFMAAGLPTPPFFALPADAPLAAFAERIRFPCVLKPLALSGSRGVIRADSLEAFVAARARIHRILDGSGLAPSTRDHRAELLVEEFVPGHEFALEGALEHGALRVFALFEKPDPLDGPHFEETIYATPPVLPRDVQHAIAGTIAHAAAALGLRHGPVHAECRVNRQGVFVLEVAPRPIGGLCARALRFVDAGRADITLEELLLRVALGESLDGYGREAMGSAVMMIPIPAAGRYRGVNGLDAARAVPGVEDLVVTAKPGQAIAPPPEGDSYLGFVFARAVSSELAVAAVREAHRRLAFRIDLDLPVG